MRHEESLIFHPAGSQSDSSWKESLGYEKILWGKAIPLPSNAWDICEAETEYYLRNLESDSNSSDPSRRLRLAGSVLDSGLKMLSRVDIAGEVERSARMMVIVTGCCFELGRYRQTVALADRSLLRLNDIMRRDSYPSPLVDSAIPELIDISFKLSGAYL